MKYFTAKETREIIWSECGGRFCLNDDNPHVEAMKELHHIVTNDRYRSDPYWMACLGYALGRATGIREERARRKGCQA